MKPVTLDLKKLLGFRIAQADESRIGIKLGLDKGGYKKPVTVDPDKLLGFRIGQAGDSKIGIKLGADKTGQIRPE